ncbi:MAG: hypothetical protein K6G26_08185 [Lachnospiraceae bacterium]|nr:hypothetical protein [Lachnospiraceae bacterium]
MNNRQIFAAMVTYGFLTYHDGKISIPNKELMLKFEAALEDECLDVSRLSDEMREVMEL